MLFTKSVNVLAFASYKHTLISSLLIISSFGVYILSANSFPDASAAASLLFEMNGSKHDKTSRERSDDPFSFPRQKRSVRPRLYLSIESDSEEER